MRKIIVRDSNIVVVHTIRYSEPPPHTCGAHSQHDSSLSCGYCSNVLFLQVEILEGALVCPETGRKFPISNGIPNMLLNEDEV